MFGGQVTQGVGADDLIDLDHRPAGGHQQFLVGDVGAEVAGVLEGRCRNPEVDFPGAGVPQQLDDPAEVVPRTMESYNQHHPLVPHRAGDDVQLDADAVFPLFLAALDEGAADVFVLDEADAVGDAAFHA